MQFLIAQLCSTQNMLSNGDLLKKFGLTEVGKLEKITYLNLEVDLNNQTTRSRGQNKSKKNRLGHICRDPRLLIARASGFQSCDVESKCLDGWWWYGASPSATHAVNSAPLLASNRTRRRQRLLVHSPFFLLLKQAPATILPNASCPRHGPFVLDNC